MTHQSQSECTKWHGKKLKASLKFLKVPFGIEPECTLELDIVVPYHTGIVMLKGLKGSVNLPQDLIGFTLICRDFQELKEIFLTEKNKFTILANKDYYLCKIIKSTNLQKISLQNWQKNKSAWFAR